MIRVVATAAIAVLFAITQPTSSLAQSDGQKAVLITGASSGIGRNMTETLAAAGHFVYAGARKQEDIDELNAIENVMAVRLDVNKQDEIDAAVELIQSEGRGLYGLVNNAGVGVIGPLIELDEDDMQFQMNVNLFGPYRVTRAFAPLIIESKGRITTTGSISGILSGPLFGAYAMSKHAVEAFTDALAVEMRKFDVKVSVIEPGNYRSDIYDSLVRRMEARGRTGEGSLYEEEIKRFLAASENRGEDKAPDEVSAALIRALFDENPKRRYMVVPNERQAEITIRQAMRELVQLNEDHQYSYSRDELVDMLDELLNPPAD